MLSEPAAPVLPETSASAPFAPVLRSGTLRDETATAAFGERLARALTPGLLITLAGGLGVGKTTLVRAVLRALGHTGPVRSPSFTLLEPYTLPGLTLLHFDCYRMASPEEWAAAGFDDALMEPAVCLVEWAELARMARPTPDLAITLDWPADAAEGSEQRRITLVASTSAGLPCLNALDAAS